ncbi:hypothetical protein PV327_002400 [Microctonus hyperodae]|uniref:Uncharacterized protein n=1 Tax=Microctonus hyperodae TaxID=165561 RepID=A0AA39FFH5_MICHY|nr:hypothetical protein PV327_002400 [Microctonus hyperodae]
MISKYTILLCLVATAAASVIPSIESSHDLVFNYNNLTQKTNPNSRYHIVIGSRLYDDVLQFEEVVQGKSGIKVRFNINPNLLINAVTVIDKNLKGNGDFPVVVEGGIVVVFLSTVAITTSIFRPSVHVLKADLPSNKSHNLLVGSRRNGDRLVIQQYVIQSSGASQFITVQKTFNVSKYEKITLIRALDQKNDGTGAYPSLLKGGPGTSNATLEFKSQKNKSINFLVMIYSKK